MQKQTRLPGLDFPVRSTDARATIMNLEAHVGLYYLFVEEVLQRGVLAAAERFLHNDFVAHGSAGDHDRHAFIVHLAARRARFPDAVWTIEALTGVGRHVVCYLTMIAPHLEDQVWESVVVRFDNDRIVESWSICHQLLRPS